MQQPLSLYDLSTDIAVTTNVSEQNPEIMARLLEMAAEARRQLGDGLTKSEGEENRRPGSIESN